MKRHMRYLESPSTDPYFNLALEEYLFQQLDSADGLFMLWQNDNAIVIGRYQNAVQEINQAFVREHGIHVVRRLSGGGAVYHDLGNLNFTFITPEGATREIDFHFFCQPILSALAQIDIHAELTGRNDLTIEGKKFSGNSQYIMQGRVLHHGTLMFRSDLSVVSRALRVDRDKVESKGIPSVSSRVANIADYLSKDISLQEFKYRLVEAVSKDTPLLSFSLEDKDLAAVSRLRDNKYSTWEWNYGRSPQYTVQKKRRFEGCGSVEVSMSVAAGGAIEGIQFFGDFFGREDCAGLENALVGLPCRYEAIYRTLKEAEAARYIHGVTAEQLASLLAC